MHLRRIKKTAYVALVLLLICAVLLTATSYAWLVISRMPEVTGIETNIGSNGSLELALLSAETYADPSLIRTKVGDSAVVQDSTVSNLAWGNLVDLSGSSYGLSEISLVPAWLNVSGDGLGGAVVNGNMLMIPTFGIDGRFSKFNADTVSAVYNGESFLYRTGSQTYGVRGIGEVSNVSAQQTALAEARSSVATYTSGARSTITYTWQAHGPDVFEVLDRMYVMGEDGGYTDAHAAALRELASGILDTLDYLELALRKGMLGFAAASIEDEEEFETMRAALGNMSIPLSTLIDSGPVALPDEIGSWVTTLERDKEMARRAVAACDALEGGSYGAADMNDILLCLLDDTAVYLGEQSLSGFTGNLGVDNELTMAPNSGPMAHIADFIGNYNVLFTYASPVSVEVRTTSTASPAHLTALSAALQISEPAGGGNAMTEIPLKDTYGYAVDMAFRCNTESDLLLQTMPAQRIDGEAGMEQTQGGGSYMRFSSEQLTTEQIVLMMDAIRVAFVDDRNTLLAVAKLNTSNYEEGENGVTAPLYLYEFTVSAGGQIVTGERLDEDTAIAGLPTEQAAVITTIVWLDGDHMDNSLAANSEQSVDGVLNLQFASSADLRPADQTIRD